MSQMSAPVARGRVQDDSIELLAPFYAVQTHDLTYRKACVWGRQETTSEIHERCKNRNEVGFGETRPASGDEGRGLSAGNTYKHHANLAAWQPNDTHAAKHAETVLLKVSMCLNFFHAIILPPSTLTLAPLLLGSHATRGRR